MAHTRLNLDDTRNIDAQRAQSAAKIVKAQASQANSLDRCEIATTSVVISSGE
jgi:hypothetical protein